MKEGPVFVAGLERSGTSLLFALLASHPGIAMTRRTNLWTYFYDRYGKLDEPANLDRCLETMRRYKRLVVLDIDFDRLRTDFGEGPATYGRLFELLERQHAERLDKPRWGDKSLNTEKYAEAVFAAYPEATIFHMIRDPRDRFASVQTRWKIRKGGIGAGVAEWLGSARLAARNQDLYPNNYRVVPYEILAEKPEQTLRELCWFMGAAYTPAMLSMAGAEGFRDQGANSSYGPREAGVISTDSIGRYREVLTLRQIAFIQATAHRHMESFGYPSQRVDLSVRRWAGFFTSLMPVELGKMAGWQLRNGVRNYRGRRVPGYRLVEVEP